jgi:hypothetical protein
VGLKTIEVIIWVKRIENEKIGKVNRNKDVESEI